MVDIQRFWFSKHPEGFQLKFLFCLCLFAPRPATEGGVDLTLRNEMIERAREPRSKQCQICSKMPVSKQLCVLIIDTAILNLKEFNELYCNCVHYFSMLLRFPNDHACPAKGFCFYEVVQWASLQMYRVSSSNACILLSSAAMLRCVELLPKACESSLSRFGMCAWVKAARQSLVVPPINQLISD